jgi:hypothetical protein
LTAGAIADEPERGKLICLVDGIGIEAKFCATGFTELYSDLFFNEIGTEFCSSIALIALLPKIKFS